MNTNTTHKQLRRKIIPLFGQGRSILFSCVLALYVSSLTSVYLQQAVAQERPEQSGSFERIILTWSGNPATTQAVTWRTPAAAPQAIAQIARAEASPDFSKNVRTFPATTTEL